MATAGQRLAAAVQAAAEEERQMFGDHPSPDQLIAYQERRLPPDEAAPLKEHLALCPSCASTVLDLESFPEIEPPDIGLLEEAPEPPEHLRQALQELQKVASRSSSASVPTPFPAASPTWRIPATLAAGLAAAALALAFWGGTLWPPGSGTPSTEAPVATAAVDSQSLEPRGFRTTREPLTPTPLPVAADAEQLLLELAVPPGVSQAQARLEVVDSTGRIFWSVETASRRQDGQYKIQLPLSLLPEGAIEIRLLEAGSAADAEPFAVYDFRLETLPER